MNRRQKAQRILRLRGFRGSQNWNIKEQELKQKLTITGD